MDSNTTSTSTISRDQFQTPPTGYTNESTPVQGAPISRQQPSPPNIFAFEDNEASTTPTAAIGTGRIVSDDGKRLTREEKDKDNELMAIAAASAEAVGFDPGLILGNIQPHRLSTVIEAGETTPVTTTGRRPSIIARPRSAFIEEIEDEDSAKAKRQLGQHEFSAEAYLSQAEILAREEARSRSEEQLASGSHSVHQDEPSVPPTVPNPTYSSTPEGLGPRQEPAPPPRPIDAPANPPEIPHAQSAPPPEVIQERKNRAHAVTRSGPAARSASVSGSLSSTREEEEPKRPSTSRSSSLSGFFRRKKDKDSTPSLADSGVGLDTDDGTRRGRVPKSDEEEAQMRRERQEREMVESESSRGRRERVPSDQHAAEEPLNLPRRSMESVITTHESQSHENEPHYDRHSRRSIDSAYRGQEGFRPAEGADIDEEEGGSKAETESLRRAKSKVRKVGKIFGWANRSKREKSSSRSREPSQTRGESVGPMHKRSGSDASGPKDRPGNPRHNTEESEQFTPPRGSGASSLRDVDMGYDIVGGESFAPTPNRDEPEPPIIDAASLTQHIEANMAKATQHAETKSLHHEASPVEPAEIPERPKSERKLSDMKSLSGVFRAARQFKRSTTTSRIPTQGERPAELTRADTDSKSYRPSSSSGGDSMHQSGFTHSSQGSGEGQRVAGDAPSSSAAEDSRAPLTSARSGSLRRKSTKSLRSLSESQAGSVGQNQAAETTDDGRESDSNIRLPRKSASIERKVKETANSHAHNHDGEPVAKSYNYVEKSTSAEMLTRSEGVDLSSDFRGQHENTQSFSEPPDIFDDRDSPPSNETLPIESSPNSPLYSPIQQSRISDNISFSSRTPSPILKSAVVDIYEEHPALPQSSPSSPDNFSPINQNIHSEQLLAHDEEIPALPFSGLSSYVQTPAAGNFQPQFESQTQSPFMNFFQSAFHNFSENATSSPSWAQLPNVFSEERSISPKDISIPITETQQFPPTTLGDSSENNIPETFEEHPALPQTEESIPLIQNPEPPTVPNFIPEPYPAPVEANSLTSEDQGDRSIEVPPISSIFSGEPKPLHHDHLEDTILAVDDHSPLPIETVTEYSEDGNPIKSSPPSPNLSSEASGNRQLPASGLHESPDLEQVLSGETTQTEEEQRPVDPIFDMLETLPALPDSPIEEFGQSTKDLLSSYEYDIGNDLSAPTPSKPETRYNVQEQPEVNSNQSSPHLPDLAPEDSHYLSENGPHMQISQVGNNVAQSQLPPLQTEFQFPDVNDLPQLPPSSSSSASLDWVSAGSPSENDPVSVGLGETFTAHFLSQDVSPVSPIAVSAVASVAGLDTSSPSQPGSPSHSEIERNVRPSLIRKSCHRIK